jgi:hypothetical protein
MGSDLTVRFMSSPLNCRDRRKTCRWRRLAGRIKQNHPFGKAFALARAFSNVKLTSDLTMLF